MPPVRTDIAVIPARPQDRPAIEAVLRRCGIFNEAEIAVALEVLDVYLDRPGQQDYQVSAASLEGRLAGYVCFGRNTMTDGVFELYWIAVDPESRRHGVGRALMDRAEREAARQGGRMIAVETSSREDYGPTRRFYAGLGYREAAVVEDYYAVGDAKVILTKRIGGGA